jgi:hypothetical protein
LLKFRNNDRNYNEDEIPTGKTLKAVVEKNITVLLFYNLRLRAVNWFQGNNHHPDLVLWI